MNTSFYPRLERRRSSSARTRVVTWPRSSTSPRSMMSRTTAAGGGKGYIGYCQPPPPQQVNYAVVGGWGYHPPPPLWLASNGKLACCLYSSEMASCKFVTVSLPHKNSLSVIALVEVAAWEIVHPPFDRPIWLCPIAGD